MRVDVASVAAAEEESTVVYLGWVSPSMWVFR